MNKNKSEVILKLNTDDVNIIEVNGKTIIEIKNDRPIDIVIDEDEFTKFLKYKFSDLKDANHRIRMITERLEKQMQKDISSININFK